MAVFSKPISFIKVAKVKESPLDVCLFQIQARWLSAQLPTLSSVCFWMYAREQSHVPEGLCRTHRWDGRKGREGGDDERGSCHRLFLHAKWSRAAVIASLRHLFGLLSSSQYTTRFKYIRLHDCLDRKCLLSACYHRTFVWSTYYITDPNNHQAS